MSVMIDPYMFEMSEEQEIQNNLHFFRMIIKLCTNTDPHKRLSVILYKGILDRMNQRYPQLFPIRLENITDSDLKQTLLQLNMSFNNVLLKNIEEVEFDICEGEQNFLVLGDRKEANAFKEDDHYYEMLYTLLIPCYKHEISIDDRIITGEKRGGKQIGDKFEILCNCSVHEYIKSCRFVGIDEFIPLQEKLINELKVMRKNNKISIAERIPATINGDHHVHVCSGGRRFNYLDQLSLKNRIVLQQLRVFGLYEIKFSDFRSEPGKIVGNMSIQDLEEREVSDILNVRFFAETGFTVITALYFPKGVGKIIHQYFNNDKRQLTYQNVNHLVERTS